LSEKIGSINRIYNNSKEKEVFRRIIK